MEVLHNSCNMCTLVLPDMYTLIPRACGPRDSGVHIRQNTRVHVTTIKCASFTVLCLVSLVSNLYTYGLLTE